MIRKIGLCLLTVTPLFGAGYSHGTAAAILTSRGAIAAAIDSKEVNREYLNDGTLITSDRISCKVRQAGPYYAMIAGISRATGGFNALASVSELYRERDTLEAFAARLEEELPLHLASALNNVVDFDRSFLDQDVLQIALLGVENEKPRALIVAFTASEPEPRRIAVRARRSAAENAVHLLGMHAEAEAFLAENPAASGAPTTDRALQFIQLEYSSHPEFVGGPATILRVTPAGVTMEQPGACVAAGIPRIVEELDDAIRDAGNIMVREDVSQYSQRGSAMKTGSLHATVRVVGGVEDYGWKGRLPEPWCGGELSTMMRVTREVFSRGRPDLSADGDSLVMRFHAGEADRYWQLVIGSAAYPLAFDGTAWFSPVTGKLLRVRWEAVDLHLPASAGIARLEWDETFVTGDIAGRPQLIPDTALYRVSYTRQTARVDWTETHFSDFRRFGSTQSIQFNEASIR